MEGEFVPDLMCWLDIRLGYLSVRIIYITNSTQDTGITLKYLRVSDLIKSYIFVRTKGNINWWNAWYYSVTSLSQTPAI